MKGLHLLFWVVGCLGQRDGFDYYENEKAVRSINGESIQDKNGTMNDALYRDNAELSFGEKYIHLFNKRLEGKYEYTDDGNPDIHGRIERPCQVYDTFCIRKFFKDHSRCQISERSVPEPLYRSQMTVNYPLTNMSATQVNVEYRGLRDARIEDFYINKITDNLVLTLNFPLVYISSNETFLKFYLRGREPVLTKDFGQIAYSVSATVVIPHLKDLRLEQAEISANFNIPAQPFIVGPGLAASTDPEVLAMVAVFFANTPRVQMEAAMTEVTFFAANVIQYNICDFGLKVL